MCSCADAYKAKWLLAIVLLAKCALYGAYHLLASGAAPAASGVAMAPSAFAPAPGRAKPLPDDPTKSLTDILGTG